MTNPEPTVDGGGLPSPQLPALPARIAMAFAAPARLFDALRERPAWIDALIGLAAINIALVYVTPVIVPEDMRRAVAESQMERFIQDPEVLAQQVEAQLNPSPLLTIGGSIVFPPLFIALVAGLIALAYGVMMGGEARFRQVYSAVAHAMYINLGTTVVAIALMAIGSEVFALTPGLFLPSGTEGFLARFLNGINVFAVWTCVALGIATSRLYPGRSVGGGAVYMLAWYLIVAAGLAALGGLAPGA